MFCGPSAVPIAEGRRHGRERWGQVNNHRERDPLGMIAQRSRSNPSAKPRPTHRTLLSATLKVLTHRGLLTLCITALLYNWGFFRCSATGPSRWGLRPSSSGWRSSAGACSWPAYPSSALPGCSDGLAPPGPGMPGWCSSPQTSRSSRSSSTTAQSWSSSWLP